jgi:hypothetical protein
MPVALNVDGLERKRKKVEPRRPEPGITSPSGSPPFAPLKSSLTPSGFRTTTSSGGKRGSTFISYGAPMGQVAARRSPAPLGLERRRYFLYVTRFEPENNPLLVRRAFEQLDTPI